MKKKILIVEDERLLADLYRDKIRKAGHDPHLAYSAEDGVIEFNKIKPNLVLLDMLLPRENGLYFLRAMKKQQEKTPVVVLSNYDDPEAKKQAFLLGAREYFIKTSLTPQQMLDKIVKYL